MKKWIVLVIVLLFGWQGTAVKAGEIEDLREQMDQQAKLLKQMQRRLEQLELSQQTQKEIVNEKFEAVESMQIGNLPASASWIEKIKWSGDFRYRHNSIDDESKTTKRNRNRYRARLKLEAQVNDEWDAIFRLGSGSSDAPTSTNQTLGDEDNDSFSSKPIWVDWAYADYHPESIPGLNLMAGKMGNPFYKAVKNQLIYDSDVSPEGGAATYGWNLDESTSAKLTGSAFWMRERSTDADTSLFGIQGLVKHKLSDDGHVLGGVSYYDFGNIQGKSLNSIGSKGNTTTGGLYANDYNVLETFGEYGFKLYEVPVTVYGTYVNNTVARTSEDTGWLVGAKYNKAKTPRSWELSYNYRDVDKDAVVGGLNDSDFIGGGTDGKGHVFGIRYQLAENTQASVHYFLSEKNVSTTGDDFDLLQADLVLKF